MGVPFIGRQATLPYMDLTQLELGQEKLAARDYPDGHPSGHQPRVTLLNFSDPLGTDVFNVLSPLANNDNYIQVQHCEEYYFVFKFARGTC
jgi:hypothetical protein